METCKFCGKEFSNTKPYRKNICRECHNSKNKIVQRRRASTVEGYFKMILNDIKNNPRRNKYENDIDLEYLMKLYDKQDGRCAISNIKMTWGFSDGEEENKQFRKPYNIGIDRVDNSIGYTEGNVVLVCNIVNFFKSNNSLDIVYHVAEEITKNKNRLAEVQAMKQEIK